jgi:hypothetical protein
MSSTNVVCGHSGSTSFSVPIKQWEATITRELPDTTSFSSNGNSEFVGCLASAEGSFTALQPCGDVGIHLNVTFTNSVGTHNCDIVVTSMVENCDASTGDVVSYEYQWVSTGEFDF